MKIYMAAIEHKEGMGLYAAYTPEELTKKIYDYVNFHWFDIFEINPGCPADMDEAIEIYFDTSGDEFISYDQDELRDIEKDPRDGLWQEFAVYYENNDELMNAIDEALKKLSDYEAGSQLSEFNEVTYDGERGQYFLDDLLKTLGIDPDDYEDD